MKCEHNHVRLVNFADERHIRRRWHICQECGTAVVLDERPTLRRWFAAIALILALTAIAGTASAYFLPSLTPHP